MRERVGAIIIKNGKILLVIDKGVKKFQTPGGAVDIGESKEEALKRELIEEIGVKIDIFKQINSYKTFNHILNIPQREENFLVKIKNKISQTSEIDEMKWFNREGLIKNKSKILEPFFDKIFPYLIKQNLID